MREYEQIRMADMIATAFHEPKKLKHRESDWKQRATEIAPTIETREEVEKWANDLWLQYSRSRRPVS